MTPVHPLRLQRWMKAIVENPLTVEDAGEAYDPSDPHQNPERAFDLEPSGVPTWYPRDDPQTGRRLSEEHREQSFLEWLGYELNLEQETLRNASEKSRRQMIARSLLHTHSELPLPEIPIPG